MPDHFIFRAVSGWRPCGPRRTLHLEPSRLEPLVFLKAYQFNRSVWHMVRGGRRARLILLLPHSFSLTSPGLQVYKPLVIAQPSH